jgi:hypothetical protein
MADLIFADADLAALYDQMNPARDDIELGLADLSAAKWVREFDLVVMTGHAFQVFVQDIELQTALAAIHSAPTDGGRFVFETRNPLVRSWELWDSEERPAVADANGAQVRMTRRITAPYDGHKVSFTHTFRSDAWDEPRISHSTLRFLDKAGLGAALARAGLTVEAQFGDWDRRPLADDSPEIITIARRR